MPKRKAATTAASPAKKGTAAKKPSAKKPAPKKAGKPNFTPTIVKGKAESAVSGRMVFEHCVS